MFPNPLLLLAVLTIGALPLFMFNIANAQSDIPPPAEGNNTVNPKLRQDLDKLLKCLVSQSGIEQMIHRALAISVGDLFNEKCAWQSQQPQQQNLLLNSGDQPADDDDLLAGLEQFSGKFTNGIYACFNEENDNSECCSNSDVPEKCLAICGKKDVALPLGTGCEVHLPKALQCMEGRTENLVLQKMVKYRQPLTAFSGFRQKQNNDNIECTTLHGACLTAASTCQLLSQFASPFGAICSLGVGAACAVETLSQDCFQEQ